jgi:peptidoglycan/xylan/chitin deacetylase (PgdA/CDA1 family)
MVRSPLSRVGRIAAREVAGLVRRLKTPRTGTARILYYHRVEDEEHRSCVKPAAFAAQMAHLRTEGYRVLALPEVRAYIEEHRPFPERTIVVTFDDGFADNYHNAFPILQKEGLPMTLFLTADYIGREELPVLRDRSGVAPLSWDQVEEMSRHGVDIGAHTLTHPELTDVDDARLEKEVAGSRQAISERLGRDIRLFCYPRGRFDERVKQAVRDAGYDLACTTMEGCVTPDTHPFSLRRTFIANDDSLRDFARKLDGSFDLLHAARARLRGGADIAVRNEA